MKNVFKFGFLGVALTVGTAACNSASNNSEETTADSLERVIDGTIDIERDSLRAIDTLDSLATDAADSLDSAVND